MSTSTVSRTNSDKFNLLSPSFKIQSPTINPANVIKIIF